MHTRFFPLLLSGSLLSSAVLAQAPTGVADAHDDSTTTTARDLTPVEVRAVRASDVSPFAKTDIGVKEIEKANLGQDFPYLLQYTPSAVTTSDAGAGVGYTGLRVRGTDGTRINVTLNGVPVNDAESQGTFFVNFPDLLSSTSSVQLQRGVGTSTNGSGAFGATLSVDNLRGQDSAGVDLIASYGSFDTRRFTLRAGTGETKSGLRFDVRASHIQSDGYVERSASRLQALQLLGSWQISEKTALRVLAMLGSEKTGQAWNGVPQDSLQTNRRFNGLGIRADGTYYPNQTDNYRQDYYQLHADHRFAENLAGHVGIFLTRGRGFYEEYRLGDAFADYGLPDVVQDSATLFTTDLVRQLWLDNYFYGSVFSLGWTKGKTALTFGGSVTQYLGEHYGIVKEANMGIPDGHRWYDLDAQKNDFNFYAKAQQGVGEKLFLFGDVQYRRVGYSMNGFRKNPDLRPAVTYNFFNPKAGLSYFLQKTAVARQKLYASVAISNREPNRDDFEVSPVSLPKPERLTDFEGGWEWNTRKATASVNGYYMRYKDQLVLTGAVNDVGAYTRINTPRSYRAGIELQGAVTPVRWLTLGGNATFSRNKIEDFVETLEEYAELPSGEVEFVGIASLPRGTTDIAFSPATIAAASATFRPLRDARLEIDLLGKYVGKQFLDNTSNDARRLDAYVLMDLRARYRLTVRRTREVLLQVQVNNVLNHLYESNGYTYSYIFDGVQAADNSYYPQAGTNVMAGVTVKL